jgi:hypothetical protein
MTPYTQTITADPARNDGRDAEGVMGDCWRTSIACLLDTDPKCVPHFVHEHEEKWYGATQEWLDERDMDIFYCPFPLDERVMEWWDRWSRTHVVGIILDGLSPRGNFYHAVVGDTNPIDVLHDPHPSRAGLTSMEGMHIIYRFR